jgi:hypothetical protein
LNNNKTILNEEDMDVEQTRISAILNNPSGKTIIFPQFIKYVPDKDFTGNDIIEYQIISFEGGVSASKIFI